MTAKKRNPRAPLLSLPDAIKYGEEIYEVAALHSVALDGAAEAIGYKDSRGGAAQKRLATLKQYGILQKDGKSNISVSEKIQILKFSPSQKEKFDAADSFFKSPPVFLSLLEKYNDTPPDDSILRFDLINMGFDHTAASVVLKYFRESFDYIKSFHVDASESNAEASRSEKENIDDIDNVTPLGRTKQDDKVPDNAGEYQEILIRLPNKRKAMLSIPVEFSKKDKIAINKQVEALWIDEE